MTPLEQQFEVLRGYFPSACLEKLPGGPHLIVVPGIELPSGWSKLEVTIKFLAPVGYPLARPDCFWTDHDLRLANGGLPQNSGPNPLPQIGGPHLWFSWHLGSWDPNSDNLLTYVYVIERRFGNAR